MGLLFGTVKFTVGVVVGASVGAAVATFIVTRDGGQTLDQLKGIMNEVVQRARDAYQAEESRQNQRRQQLIDEVGEARRASKEEKKKD